MSLNERWKKFTLKYPSARNISTLLTGTVLAQIIVMMLEPIISRLYSPEETGEFAVILAVATTITTIAGLRYDMAIVITDTFANARRLRGAVTGIITIVSVLTTLLMIPLGDTVASAVGYPHLGPWMTVTGLLVFTLAQVNSFSFWFTKTQQFKVISINRVQMRSSVQIFQIILALFSIGGIVGLVVGQIVGQAGAAATLMWKGRRRVKNEGEATATSIELLKRFRRMPLLNGPNALVDAIRLQGINLLIAALFSANAVGQFTKAWLLMQAPVTLINGAISQVFFQRFADTPRGGLLPLAKKSVKVSLAFGFGPFLIIFLIAPWLFPIYLGSRWDMSGEIARALVPWLYMNIVTSPISTVFVVTQRQHEMLAFAVLYMVTGLGAVLTGSHFGLDVVSTTWLLASLMSVALIGLVFLTLRACRLYDSQADTE
ncbi:MAG: oligosaccharide flippase family protein [Actinomycetaceae bacterium]|nr:oligosaccharide flippase family protein [Actinomycetaceae bacterium]